MVERFYVDDLFDNDFINENNDVTVVQAREILKLVTDYNTEIKKEIAFKTSSLAVYNKMFNMKNEIQNGKIILDNDDNIFDINKLKVISDGKEILRAAIEDLEDIQVAYFDNVDKYKLSFKIEDTLFSLHIEF